MDSYPFGQVLFISLVILVILMLPKRTDTNAIAMKLDALQEIMYRYITETVNETEDKVLYLQKRAKLDYFYTSVPLIEFMYELIPLYSYNKHQFIKLLRGTNNILLGKRQVYDFYSSNNEYPSKTAAFFRVSLTLKENCMNNIQNFIYTVPKQKDIAQYLYDTVNQYDNLVTPIINDLYFAYTEQIHSKGINSTTRVIDYSPYYKTTQSIHLKDSMDYY